MNRLKQIKVTNPDSILTIQNNSKTEIVIKDSSGAKVETVAAGKEQKPEEDKEEGSNANGGGSTNPGVGPAPTPSSGDGGNKQSTEKPKKEKKKDTQTPALHQ